MEQPFNKLSPAEVERLVILSEECGEVIQAIGKVLRHGWNSIYDNGTTNRAQLEIELADIKLWSNYLQQLGDVDATEIHLYLQEKRERVNSYLHHNFME
jgi:NTP pyrophosphatase (non-canonical NTP hydrolase)